jgi:hypothetical protein
MERPLRLSLSLAGTAALALASLPLAIRPAVAQEALAAAEPKADMEALMQQALEALQKAEDLVKVLRQQILENRPAVAHETPAASAEPKAETAEAADLGVMGVNLKDAVKFNWGFQGALQGAGTPNQAGIGAFIPLHVGSNSVSFLDVLVNANFKDYSDYSSIINTDVAGTTFSTSTRLGYRWLNDSRSWMFGVNAGYDSRPMATGGTDTGVDVTGSEKTVFFQQVAAGVEAVSNSWNFNAYALVPVGDIEQQLNSVYQGGALNTYGLDVGYSITPDLRASVGYYYQYRSEEHVNVSGVKGRLAYNLTNGLTVGANLSYDQAFDTRVSADIKYRFGANGYGAPSIRKQQPVVMPVIQALSTTPANRDVRVHDAQQSGAVKCAQPLSFYYLYDIEGFYFGKICNDRTDDYNLQIPKSG